MRLADYRVPNQEADGCADHQHDECTQGPGVINLFVIQVKQGRHPAKQHEHFVQVANWNVTDVWAHLVSLVPAHQSPHQRQHHSCPRQTRTQQLHVRGLAT